MLGIIINALLQPLALLLKADVQHKLQNEGAVFSQHAFKVIDLGIALRRLFWRDPAADGWHQDIFVMAAVENHDFAIGWHFGVNTP